MSIATIGYELIKEAPWITFNPTPPTPNTAIDCPGFKFALLYTMPSPVVTEHPSNAATSRGTSEGIGVTLFSETIV